MKLKKSLHFILLVALSAGLIAPSAVEATELSTTETTLAPSSTEEPSTSSEDTTTSSEDTTTSSEDTTASSEDTTTSSEEPSSTEEPSTSSEDTTTSSEDATTTKKSTKKATKPSKKKTEVKEKKETEPDLTKDTAVLEAIIGRDDQYRVKNTKVAPYRSVVYMEMTYGGDVYLGSGVMIAPNLVLTVAHNVFNKSKNRWADAVYVAPGKNGNSEPYGRFTASEYYIFRNYRNVGAQEAFNFDIAVVKLNRSVPSSVGQLSVSKSIGRGQRVQIPGYPAYTSSKRDHMHTAFGTVDDYDSKMIAHKVDTEGGNSGSPILNANNQVIGVHTSGQYTIRPYGTQNFGRRVDQSTLNLIGHARSGGAPTISVTTNKERLTGSVYRLYNAKTKQYFYTKSLNEANRIRLNGWKYEGRSFVTAGSGKPVYRLYNASRRAYVYTSNTSERQAATRRGWKDEGIAWYSGGSKKVHRLYNPRTKLHMYTSSNREVQTLRGRGWKHEGVSFYTVK